MSVFFVAVLLGPLASVGAAPSHSKPPKADKHSTPVPAPVAAAQGAGQAATEGAATSTATVTAAAGTAAGTGTGAGAGAGQGAAKHSQAKHSAGSPGKRRHAHTPAAGATGAGQSSGSVGAGAQPGAAQGATTLAAAGRERNKVKHGRPHEAKRGRHTPAAATPAGAGAGSHGTAASTGAGAVAAAATSFPVAAAVPAAAGIAPTVAAKSPRRTAKARHVARRRNATGSGAGTGAGATSGVLPFTAATPREVFTPSTATPASGGSGEGATAAGAKARPPAESPIVTTVTKIINVVPPLMRALIGGLVLLALALAASSQIAALRARRLTRQRRELLDDVGLLQAALLPPLPRRLGPVGTSAAYRPASGPGAGGDFYDVFALGDGRLAVIMGDVSGHGRHALPRTTLVRFTLRAYLEAGMEPRAALQMASPVLERQLGEAFATVALATYDPRERKLVYSCAGHPPPVLAPAGAEARSETLSAVTVCSAPPLGVGAPTGTRQTTVSVPGAALACFFTDGVVEARVQGQLFGAARLEQLVTELDEEATATTLLDRVSAAVDRRPDDMAACLLQIEGDRVAPSIALEEIELDGRSASHERLERFLKACGVQPAGVRAAATSIREAVAEHGQVVLELHYAEGVPRIVVRPRNVAMLKEWRAQVASAQEMTA